MHLSPGRAPASRFIGRTSLLLTLSFWMRRSSEQDLDDRFQEAFSTKACALTGWEKGVGEQGDHMSCNPDPIELFQRILLIKSDFCFPGYNPLI